MELRIDRLADVLLAQLTAAFPAVMIVGPRAVGKTTTALPLAKTIVRLDREAEATALQADPDALLASLDTPTLIDEWQYVPQVLGAIKRAVDADSTPGQWVVTGSAHADLLPAGRPVTGRMVRLNHWGLVQRELHGNVGQAPFFDRLRSGPFDQNLLRGADEPADLVDYVSMAMRSGFPEAIGLDAPARRRWLASWVEQAIRGDARDLGADRDPLSLRRYLNAFAANTAGVVADKTVYDAAGITRPTAVAYERVLEALFITQRLPAWHSNRLKRLVKSPKRVLVDPALASPLLGTDETNVLRDGDLLGRIIETFVIAQLRAETELGTDDVTLHHLRSNDGKREIDVVAEYPDGSVVGIEIKASSAPTPADGKHLSWLIGELGDQCIGGVLFHTGPRAFPMGDRIAAVPISSIWTAPK